jgi:hypothetical protein
LDEVKKDGLNYLVKRVEEIEKPKAILIDATEVKYCAPTCFQHYHYPTVGRENPAPTFPNRQLHRVKGDPAGRPYDYILLCLQISRKQEQYIIQ